MTALTRLFGIGALAVLLSACASRIASDVTTFGHMDAGPGSTLQVAAKDPAKAGSLEFKAYADMVGERLGALGYKQTPTGEKPALEVRIDYAVDDGKVHVRSYPDRGYPFGYYRHGWPYFYPPYHDPFYDPFDRGYDIESYVLFNRTLDVDIVRTSDGTAVFEGRVQSLGRSNHLNEVMPYLIEALFSKFPGDNGKTTRVIIKVPDKR